MNDLGYFVIFIEKTYKNTPPQMGQEVAVYRYDICKEEMK
jgi:hypothetical protein